MTDKKEKSLARGLLEERGLAEEAFASPAFQNLKDKSKRVNIDGEEMYIVEGDLLLDEDELAVYALQRETLKEVQQRAQEVGLAPLLQPDAKELVGHLVAGKLIRWRPEQELTYCVLKGTFQNEQRYQLVRNNVEKAVADWQNNCGVTFRHVAELDDSPGTANPGVLFTVREFDSQGQFIAAAFFPGDPKNRRRMLIDRTQYFDDSPGGFDKVGILRHELGHVLGFRHEHIRSEAPAICPDEDPGMDLTAYDPQSVMHYFCGGVGSRLLAITELDKIGSQRLYGPSFNDVQYADV
jgi:hypothetical protein